MAGILFNKCIIRHVSLKSSANIISCRIGTLYSLFRKYADGGILKNQRLSLCTNLSLQSENKYKVTFIKANGDRVTGSGKEGDTLLDVVVNNNLDFDGYGACEGTLTCSTCHCIFKKEDYDRLPQKPSDEELDMLDLAYDLTPTSRLGCQIQLSKELDGVEVRIPATVNDARS